MLLLFLLPACWQLGRGSGRKNNISIAKLWKYYLVQENDWEFLRRAEMTFRERSTRSTLESDKLPAGRWSSFDSSGANVKTTKTLLYVIFIFCILDFG